MADPFWEKLYISIVIITAVLNYAVLCYTFQGSFAKVALVSMLCEVAVSLIGIGLTFLANVLQGRPELLSYLGRLQWQDGIIPVGMCLICILIYMTCGNRLKRVREYELKHKKLWLILSLLWIRSALITMLPEHNEKFGMAVVIIIIGAMIFAAAAIILGIYLWRSWHRQVLRMHNYLTKQRELMRLHSEAVRHQIDSYAGMFEKQGVTPEFSFGTYRRGCLKEEDVTEVLMILLETASAEIGKAAPENRFLRLQGGTVKNQVIFRMECTCRDGKLRRIGKGRGCARMGMLKHRLKRLGGQLTVSRGGGSRAGRGSIEGEVREWPEQQRHCAMR